ncbi:MAG TPA: hypothetical protein DEG28_15030 [Porphyromonadaceae bacterium]|nr:hypothetical protein [Porphyromonadaceae bacterium]
MISGIRHCGKSVLLIQIMKKTNRWPSYLNFGDPRCERKEFTISKRHI